MNININAAHLTLINNDRRPVKINKENILFELYMDKEQIYESFMKKIAGVVKKQINEMSPDVYRRAAAKRREQGNEDAAERLDDHADNMEMMLSNAIYDNDMSYITRNYPGVLFKKDDQICCNVIVVDEAGNKSALTIGAGNAKDVLRKLDVLCQASVVSVPEKSFKIKTSAGLMTLLRAMNSEMTDAEANEADELVDELYDAIFADAEEAADITDNFIRFDFGF